MQRDTTKLNIPARRVHVWLYWLGWVTTLAVTFILRFAYSNNATDTEKIHFVMLWMMATWILTGALVYVNSHLAASYLREKYPQRWEQLRLPTSLRELIDRRGQLRRNRSWLYTEEDCEDPVVALIKSDLRRLKVWFLTVFFSYFIVGPILLLL